MKRGADPNLVGERGKTALFCVFDRFLNFTREFNTRNPCETQEQAFALLQLLLDAGADPQIRSEKGTLLQVFSKMPTGLRTLIEAKLAASLEADNR